MLTKRELEIYTYIKNFFIDKERMPTTKEVMIDCEVARGFYNRILTTLVEEGFLAKVYPNQIPYKIVIDKEEAVV